MSLLNDNHRAFYYEFRKAAKAPVMLATKLGDDWHVETKDGEQLFEQLIACCSWCAKSEGIKLWSIRRQL